MDHRDLASAARSRCTSGATLASSLPPSRVLAAYVTFTKHETCCTLLNDYYFLGLAVISWHLSSMCLDEGKVVARERNEII